MKTNIETIYQQHIKPLSHDEQLKLLAKMAEELANGKETKEPTKNSSIMELHGLGAEIWEGVDAQEYVNELRNEWEHRPPDALQIATALENGCDAFLCNDKNLKRVTELKILILDEIEL